MPSLVRSYGSAPAGGTGNVTISSVDTSGGDCLILTTSHGYNEGNPTTPTFNGSSTGVTLIGSLDTGTNGRVWAWRLLAPSGTANVVFGNGGAYRAAVYTAQVWSGVDQTTPTAAVQTASSSVGTAAAVTYTNGATGDTIIDIVTVRPVTTPTTGPLTGVSGSQTVIQNLDNGGTGITDHCLGGSAYESGSASVAMGWTLPTANRWAIMAFALKPAAASSGGRRERITRGVHRGIFGSGS